MSPTARRRRPGAGRARVRALAGGDARRPRRRACDNPRLRFAFLFFAALTFVTAMQQPLIVVFVKDVLHGGDMALGLVVSAAGLGGILGAVLGGARAGNRRPLATVVALTAIDGALLLVFAATRHVGVAAILFAAFGAIGTLAQIALATFLQRETPEEARGRTFGWLGTCVGPLSLVSVFLGPLAAGAVGRRRGPRAVRCLRVDRRGGGRCRVARAGSPWSRSCIPPGSSLKPVAVIARSVVLRRRRGAFCTIGPLALVQPLVRQRITSRGDGTPLAEGGCHNCVPSPRIGG